MPCPGAPQVSSPAANVILCNAKCQMPNANIVKLSLCLSPDKVMLPKTTLVLYTHAPVRHCSETSRDRSARPAFRHPPCVPSPNSDWSYQLRGVAMCRYQPRSDLRYESTRRPILVKSTRRKPQNGACRASRRSSACRARKTGGFHTCAHLSLPSHEHVAFKWTVFDVRISATVHVDYTSPMIRRCNVLGDGLACVSLPFLHTTLGEYRDLQI
jgi:hypothetical protein